MKPFRAKRSQSYRLGYWLGFRQGFGAVVAVVSAAVIVWAIWEYAAGR